MNKIALGKLRCQYNREYKAIDDSTEINRLRRIMYDRLINVIDTLLED